MVCGNCGNKNAYRMSFKPSGECCNDCSSIAIMCHPDVYFTRPYLDPNLVDVNKPENRNGTWITSRTHKAQLMKELRVVEGGDKRHGYRNFDPGLARRWKESGA